MGVFGFVLIFVDDVKDNNYLFLTYSPWSSLHSLCLFTLGTIQITLILKVSNMSIIYPFIHLFKIYLLCKCYVLGIGNKVVDQVVIILELMEFRAS